jgi:dipeptidyl aminopeptidase/acylaminoacyl peptidase
MRSVVNLAAALALGLLLAGTARPETASATAKPKEITPRMIISANVVMDVQLSPDGRQVLYEVRRTDWEGNGYRTELWVVGTGPGASPRKLIDGATGTSAYRSVHATWRPGGKSIVYFATRNGDNQVWEVDVASGKEQALTRMSGWKEIEPRGIQPSFLKWSPDGSRLAFVVMAAPPADPSNDPNGRKGYEASVFWPNESSAKGQLWLLTVADGVPTRITDETLSVGDIEWSPDGRRMAVSAVPVPQGGRLLDPYVTNGLDNDLYLVDLATRRVQPLVAQPGWDVAPVWSPDGRWIAFQSQRGVKDWNYSSFVAVVGVSGGPVRYLDEKFQKIRGSGPSGIVWDAPSSGVYFQAMYRGRRPLFYASLDGMVRPVTSDEAFFQNYSVLPGKNLLALTREQITVPADVYVTPLDRFAPRKLTDLNPDWPREGLPSIDRVQWKSHDGMVIHGHLLLPPGATASGLPTIVFLPGGPSMARTGFQFDESFYPFLTFATRGYAVFVPNNRGRNGWGMALRQAMPDHSDFLPGPYRDVMAGIDTLVDRGLADPSRLGLTGFSFGACLTAYAITQTNRFRAASLDEGYTDFVHHLFSVAGKPDAIELQRDQVGFELPWDPAALKVLMDQSPIYMANRIRTPTLLEYGALSAAKSAGAPLFGALQQFHVPSKFIVYPRTGHGVEEPVLLLDSFERNLAWFDRWLLGKE